MCNSGCGGGAKKKFSLPEMEEVETIMNSILKLPKKGLENQKFKALSKIGINDARVPIKISIDDIGNQFYVVSYGSTAELIVKLTDNIDIPLTKSVWKQDYQHIMSDAMMNALVRCRRVSKASLEKQLEENYEDVVGFNRSSSFENEIGTCKIECQLIRLRETSVVAIWNDDKRLPLIFQLYDDELFIRWMCFDSMPGILAYPLTSDTPCFVVRNSRTNNHEDEFEYNNGMAPQYLRDELHLGHLSMLDDGQMYHSNYGVLRFKFAFP